MTYTSLAEVKTYLGITDTSFDTILTELVSDADLEINNILQVDGLAAETATELIRYKDIKVNNGGLYGHARFAVKNYPVTALNKINGETYTGTIGIRNQYFVEQNRYINLVDLYNYTTNDKFEFIEVEYDYGYATIPDDIAQATKLWVAATFRRKYPMYALSGAGTVGQVGDVTSYALGDERISFG